MLADASPIAAIATAPGRGGIGVVRLSGKQLRPLIHAVCRLDGGRELKNRQATYLDFIQADGSVIDRGLAIYFSAPNSYTGEDVLELQGHGGPVVMQMLLNRCLDTRVLLSCPDRIVDEVGGETRLEFKELLRWVLG